MSTRYAQEWPVPPASQQPPNRPLRTRRHDSHEYQCGMIFSPPAGTSATRSYSLLHSGFPGKFELEETCHEKSKKKRCVRKKRGVRQWKKFYPFVSSDKIVCVSEKGLKMT